MADTYGNLTITGLTRAQNDAVVRTLSSDPAVVSSFAGQVTTFGIFANVAAGTVVLSVGGRSIGTILSGVASSLSGILGRSVAQSTISINSAPIRTRGDRGQ